MSLTQCNADFTFITMVVGGKHIAERYWMLQSVLQLKMEKKAFLQNLWFFGVKKLKIFLLRILVEWHKCFIGEI